MANRSEVYVNGNHYTFESGGSVSVIGNKVYVNGEPVESLDNCTNKEVKIYITGDNNTVQTGSGDVYVNGCSNTVTTKSGDIDVRGDVIGDAITVSGDINAKTIHGMCSSKTGDISGMSKYDYIGMKFDIEHPSLEGVVGRTKRNAEPSSVMYKKSKKHDKSFVDIVSVEFKKFKNWLYTGEWSYTE